MPLYQGTDYVLPDEPCLGLFELNLQSQGSKGFHRYQILLVVRGDRIAEYREDMGLAKKFKHDQLRIIGGIKDPKTNRLHIDETVGRLREYACQLRKKPSFNKLDLIGM